MPRWAKRVPRGAALLALGGALLAGCGASSSAGHPTIDPDVGTVAPPSGPGSDPSGPIKSAASCPATFGQLEPANGPVRPGVTGAGTLGVPAGPRQAAVCYYGRLGSATPPSLRWSRTLSGPQAVALLAVVDARPEGPGDLKGPISCPMDNGSAAILRFSYAAQPSQDVLVRLTGCRSASSEHATTMFRDDIARAILAMHAPIVED
jgi:hypothetical protein